MSVVLLFLGCWSLCIPLLSRSGHFCLAVLPFLLLCPWFVWEKRLMHNEWRFWVLLPVISCRHGGFGLWSLVLVFTAAALYSARDAIPPLSYFPLYILLEEETCTWQDQCIACFISDMLVCSCVRVFVCLAPVGCVGMYLARWVKLWSE